MIPEQSRRGAREQLSHCPVEDADGHRREGFSQPSRDAFPLRCSLGSVSASEKRSPSPMVPSVDHSTLSTSASVLSTSPAPSGSLGALCLPAHILEPLGHGNNGQVFLAQIRVNSECENNGEKCSVVCCAAEQPQQNNNCHQTPQSRFGDAEGEPGCSLIAVKLVNSLSKHAQREVVCLQHLDSCRRSQGNTHVVPDVNGSGNHTECGSFVSRESPLLIEACHSQLPSPQLFFVKQVEGRVAIGLELLGLDLFEFTGKCILYENEICLIGIELLRTLRALHGKGLVHRSVKPENFCWNEADLRLVMESKEGVCFDGIDNGAPPPLCPPAFMFKMVDFGRGTIELDNSAKSNVYERPYDGWWHSLNGFLGKPMGQKDDLMGIAHTIGYFLDDYKNYYDREDGFSSSQRSDYDSALTTESALSDSTASPNCRRSAGEDRSQGVGQHYPVVEKRRREEVSATKMGDESASRSPTRSERSSSRSSSGSDSRSYPSWRRHLAGKIARAYDEAEKRQTKQVASKRAGSAHGGVETPANGSHRSLLTAEDRSHRRALIVHEVEKEFLPGLLPDVYYPPTMPRWWVEWYDMCSKCCSDASISAEMMAMMMMDGLQQRLDTYGGTVRGMRRSLVRVYFSVMKKRGLTQKVPPGGTRKVC